MKKDYKVMSSVFTDKKPFAYDKVGFGLYHFGQGGKDARGFQDNNHFPYDGDDREQCNYQESLGYMNFYSYRMDEASYMHLRRIREAGCVTWVHHFPFERVVVNGQDTWMPKVGWKEETTRQVEGLKKAGLWDTVVGFQYDEPLLHTDGDTFEEFSAFMATFGKRQFPVFSIYEIKEGSHPRSSDPEFGMTAHVINPSNTRYITDIAFDWYAPADRYDQFKAYNDLMLNDIQRDNLYVWGFPTAFQPGGRQDYDEKFFIDSLEMHRKLLDTVKYPGGLFPYTWRSWSKPQSLDFHLHTENPNRWKNYQKALIETGKELGKITLKTIK